MQGVRIQKKICNQNICSIPDKSSPQRELFLESHEPVSYTLNMVDEKAIPLFEKLPEDLLPMLPVGYQWSVEKSKAKPVIFKSTEAPNHNLDIFLYGPDGNKINYILQVDGVTSQSFSHTKQGKGPERKFPMTPAHFTVSDFDYNDSQSHIRGHCIDHQDTMLIGPQKFYSTYDYRNYIPEPHYKYWGLTMRRIIAAEIRKEKGAYMQFVHYPETPYTTTNGTQVPDYGYFYKLSVERAAGKITGFSVDNVYNFDWETNYASEKEAGSVLNFVENYETETQSAPLVKLYDASASDRAFRLQIRNMQKKSLSIKNGNIASLDKNRDRYFINNMCADKEFEQINRKLEASLHANKIGETLTFKNYLKRAERHGNSLLELDEKTEIIHEKYKEKIEKLDCDEGIKDSLMKIYKDPLEK